MELAEEFRALGDVVEKFSYGDAFPDAMQPRGRGKLKTLASIVRSNRSFALRAEAYVRRNASRFDIIDANQTDLTVSKSSLGFTGLLVARSVGLISAYADFHRIARKRWPEGASPREMVHRLLTIPRTMRQLPAMEKSFRYADLITVSNRDDLETVGRSMGYGEKVICFPFGLSQDRLNAFSASRLSTTQRLKARTVAFIGMWNNRKGRGDWPRIFESLRRIVPDAKLILLGAGLPVDHVLRDFTIETRGAVRVVSSYENDELPDLLGPATVGAFPGYLEGFGFGVLEMLAAGLPTVAYDAPGSRDILGRLRKPTTAPPGNTEAFARLLAETLTLQEEHYAKCAEESAAVARTFAWAEIARQTRAAYLDRLSRIRRI